MAEVEVLLPGSNLYSESGLAAWCSVVLVTGRRRTLVDVGHVGRRIFLLEALRSRGIAPQDIDVVVMSHAHWDHNQNYDLFPHAPLVLHPWERKYARNPHPNDWATPRWSGAMIDTHPNINEAEDGYEIEPGVWVMHTPGHSPGSIAIIAETAEGPVAVTGDTLHFATAAVTRVNPLVFWNAEQATRSIDRLLEAAPIIYPGHDRPFRHAGGRTEYLAPFRMTVGGVRPDMEGIAWADSWPEFYKMPWVMPGVEQQTPDSLR
jgi:glyoxylase-like metal-dependent hydrolase (beta-lactamase superfamily II)